MHIREKIGNLVTFAVGVGFIAIGIFGYFQMGHFLDAAREVSAVVVDVSKASATPKGRRHPVVRFDTEDGRTIVNRSDQHHNVRPGDTLRVIYDPRNPADMEITTLARAQNRRWMFAGLSVAVGLFVCALALGIDVSRWRPRSR